MDLRGKFVFTLVVYAAGFLTAIYCLAPAPEQTPGQSGQRGLAMSSLKSDELARSVNSGMHKAIDLGKEAAVKAAKLLRERIEKAQSKTEG